MNADTSQSFLTKGFQLHIGNFSFEPAYWQAIAIVFLLFLLVITMAQVRRHFLDWSVKGASFGIFLGFVLCLIIEGFLLLGGHTILTEVLGWKSAPKPLASALDVGKSQLIKVLGTQTQIPTSQAMEKPTSQDILKEYQGLEAKESRKVRQAICTP